MGDALATSGFSDVGDKLRDRIKASFVDLIPDENWDAMLKGELTKFMAQRAGRDNYNRETMLPSEFSTICQKHLSEMVHEDMKLRFEQIDAADVRAAIAEWIAANHQLVLQEFIANLFKSVTASLVGRLQFDIQNWLSAFLNRR